MSLPTRFPGTTWDPTSGKGGLTFKYKDKPKLVLHTTEGSSLPDYPNPPHMTADYRDGKRSRWQHVEFDAGAYALKGGSSCGSANYQTGLVYQVEHIGYAKDVENYPDSWYEGLTEEVMWFHDNLAVPYVFPNYWGYGECWGTSGKARMSCGDYRNFTGILAHQHAPSPNDHWDAPFDVARLQAMIGQETGMVTWKSKDGYTYNTDDWDPHENGIKFVIDGGIMLGSRDEKKKTGDFMAQDSLKRGEFATVMKRFSDDVGLTAKVTD